MKNSKELSADVVEHLMTTKEVAIDLGVSERTVKSYSSKLGFTKNGKKTLLNKAQVTLIVDSMQKANNNQHNLTEQLSKVTTELTPALKVQQFISSIDYNDESAVDMVTATITALSSNLIAALHGENKSLVRENKMLKHQVEYNEVIGCSRWRDVKKLLCIRDNWETVCQKLNFEDHVDYFKKCMGDDTHPTTLLPDSTIERIKKEYCKK